MKKILFFAVLFILSSHVFAQTPMLILGNNTMTIGYTATMYANLPGTPPGFYSCTSPIIYSGATMYYPTAASLGTWSPSTPPPTCNYNYAVIQVVIGGTGTCMVTVGAPRSIYPSSVPVPCGDDPATQAQYSIDPLTGNVSIMVAP